jgi:hypothetical protein
VSPSWRDEIAVNIAPSRVCLVRVGRGFRPAVIAEHEMAVQAEANPGWVASLDALKGLLSGMPCRGAALRMVVSDCWVRYASVPWVDALRSRAEQLEHARQILATTYGEAVQDWEVVLSESPPQRTRVACTMPAELLARVQTLCLQHDLRLASLQPQLVVAYQNWRHLLPVSGAWFVCIGEGTLAAARIATYAWDRVHTVRVGTDWARELKRLHTFGRLAGRDPQEGRVFVDAPLALREVAGRVSSNLHWLVEETAAQTPLGRLERLRRLAA